MRIVPVEFVDEVLREALVLENPDEFLKRPAAVEPKATVEPAPLQPQQTTEQAAQ
jgi:ATP-dependent Lon protease